MIVNEGLERKLLVGVVLLLSSKMESKTTQLGQQLFKLYESIWIILVGLVNKAGLTAS